ncbi:hypothetical protein [Glycocaulis sp.]|uniref:hypothetical protein n=1 Tax=Glycocaulis sp. TaxID=1969725 RepID=UPI003D22FF47
MVMDPDPEWDEYYYALGEFIQNFGLTERELTQTLSDFIIIYCLELPTSMHEIPHALLGSRRMAQICETINKIAKMSYVSEPYLSDVKRCTDHLGSIRFLRDTIAHNGVLPDLVKRGWYSTDNTHNSGDFDKQKFVSFKIEHLKKATDDLFWCQYRISIAFTPKEYREKRAEQSAKGHRGKVRNWLLNPLERPWSYKPQELVVECLSWPRQSNPDRVQKF